jgi:hypothetical protein
LGNLALAELAAEAPPELGRNLGDFHAWNHQEFAGQHGARAIVVGELADDLAVLALLIPAETAVGDGLRADVLEGAKEAVLLGNVKGAAEHGDGNEPLVRAENVRH